MNTEEKLPKIKYETEWDLTQLYSSLDEIEKHVKKIERAYKKFEKKYRDKDNWLTSQGRLLSALEEWEDLFKLNPHRPITYLMMRRALESGNEEVEALYNIVSEKMTHIVNRVLFFPLALGNLPPSKKKEYIKGQKLKPFQYYLQQIFQQSKYKLSEEEERVVNLFSLPAQQLWVHGVSKEVGQLTVEYKKKEIPLAEALKRTEDLPTVERRKLWKLCMDALESVSDFATHEINAVVTTKKIEDNLRGFKKPYSESVMDYENTEENVEGLVEAVTDQFKISRKYYRLKKELLGLKRMEYADRQANIGSISTTFSFDEQVQLFREALENVRPEYREFFDAMLKEGRIDVAPKKGKKGGAFCICSNPSSPVFALLNDVGTFDSFRTLSHEMGHALHGEMTKKHVRPTYQSFPTSTAEVASTYFENIAFDHVFGMLDEKEQVIALHDKLDSSMATIFRQIALFNFEKELHTTVREEGAVSKERLKKTLNEHMQSYLGDAVEMKDMNSNLFVTWPHIRFFFYVYTYAYGEITSAALYSKYKENPAYEEKVYEFLAAGGSMSPEDIFKRAGLDLSTQFFKDGLKLLNKEVNRLKRLAKKADMIK
ncbi:MAG: M3 family metallopeptidase [Candidatus Paceibacterota bacterium]